MIATIVELTISILSLVSVFLAGKTNILAWPALILAHAIFLTYTFVMDTEGFSLLNVGMIIIATENWRLWRKNAKNKAGSDKNSLPDKELRREGTTT